MGRLPIFHNQCFSIIKVLSRVVDVDAQSAIQISFSGFGVPICFNWTFIFTQRRAVSNQIARNDQKCLRKHLNFFPVLFAFA
jgi:hypothetical protein